MKMSIKRMLIILCLLVGCYQAHAECEYKRPTAVDHVTYNYYGLMYNAYLFYFGDNTGYANMFVFSMGQAIYSAGVSFRIIFVTEGWGIIPNDPDAMGNYLPILYYVDDFDNGPWFCAGPNNQLIPMRARSMDVAEALSLLRMPNKIFYCE